MKYKSIGIAVKDIISHQMMHGVKGEPIIAEKEIEVTPLIFEPPISRRERRAKERKKNK